MKNRLEELMRSHTKVKKDGFSIFINQETADWNDCIINLGRKNAYLIMAEMLNKLFLESYGEEYIYSDECMAYEIGYHADAYFKALKYKGYHSPFLTHLLFKKVVISHSEVIDISTYDMRSRIQMIVFKYKKGIRECYKGTDRDPFKRHD